MQTDGGGCQKCLGPTEIRIGLLDSRKLREFKRSIGGEKVATPGRKATADDLIADTTGAIG